MNFSRLFLLLLLAGSQGCGGAEPVGPPPKPKAPDDIVVTDIEPEGFPGVLIATGIGEVRAPFSTNVLSYKVALGETVAKDQVIAELDLEPLQAELAAAKAEVDSQTAVVRAAGSEQAAASRALARLRRAGDIVAGSQIEAAQVAVSTAVGRKRQAEAALASAKAKIEELQRRARDATIRAPMDGKLTQKYIETGARVEANMPVVRIIAGSLQVRFAIPAESERPAVGTLVDIRTDDSGVTLKGKITSVSPEVDSVAKMHIAEAEIIGSSDNARSGEGCTIIPQRNDAPATDTKPDLKERTLAPQAPASP